MKILCIGAVVDSDITGALLAQELIVVQYQKQVCQLFAASTLAAELKVVSTKTLLNGKPLYLAGRCESALTIYGVTPIHLSREAHRLKQRPVEYTKTVSANLQPWSAEQSTVLR